MNIKEKLLRYFYVYFIYILTFFISGFILNFIQLLLHIIVKPRNKYLYRKINYYLCYALYSQMLFLAEWYAGAEVILYVDKKKMKKYMGKEHAYVISNHKYEIDWLMVGLLLEKNGCGGNYKAFMKKALQYAPALGWSLFFSDNVFLERSFEKDKDVIQKQITELINYPDPMWLLLCPEGTRYTPEKYEVSARIAKEKGLPHLNNLLSPRTKGFVTSLAPMQNKQHKMAAIYDITITFTPDEDTMPTTNNMLMGGKMSAHIYLNRIPFEEVPLDEDGASKFLHDMFVQKDKLQDSMLKTGDYFAESGVERLDKIILRPSKKVFFNGIFWHFAILGPIFYYLINMLYTATFYKIVIVYGLLFLVSFALSQMFGISQTKKGSTYGIEQKKQN